jgi:hypothetical protein
LAAHRADQAAEDAHREITEADVLDDEHDAADVAPAAETAVPDMQDTSTASEHADPEPGRVLTADETAEAVRRAQEALAEIAARRAGDEQREAEEEAARHDQLARWSADDDRAAGKAGRDHDDDLVWNGSCC